MRKGSGLDGPKQVDGNTARRVESTLISVIGGFRIRGPASSLAHSVGEHWLREQADIQDQLTQEFDVPFASGRARRAGTPPGGDGYHVPRPVESDACAPRT